MDDITIEGTITRNGVTTSFLITTENGWSQWGGDTPHLGANVELLTGMTAKVADESAGVIDIG